MKDNRILWIDCVRNIGMWLVVLGHSFCSEDLKQYIYSFHMPLFFFLSGIFWREENYIRFVSHKFKTLIIPYLVFNILVYGLYLLGIIHLFSSDVIWYEPLLSIVFGYGALCCHASWFLVCLFIVENIYYGLRKYVRGYFIIILLVGVLGTYYIPFIKFWDISIALVGLFFSGLGQVSRKYVYQLASIDIYMICGLAIAVLLASLYPVYVNGRVDMVFNIYGSNYYLFILNALLGIVFVLCWGILLNRMLRNVGASLITYISKNLILVVLLHPFSNAVIFKFLPYQNDWWNVIISFLSIFLLIPVIFLIDNVFPWMIGRKIPVYKMKFS